MSDSDADDSGFDREAERERLREKYENDQEDREQTQRMSELLLQGATMTNKHCDTCGNPIFRYDGQEFCAVCQQETAEQAGGDEPQQAATTERTEETDRSNTAEPSADATASRDQDPAPDTAEPRHSKRSVSGTSETAAHGDLGEARAAITRTLTTMAQRAETADDVRRTREYLEATRDAADALAAIERLR